MIKKAEELEVIKLLPQGKRIRAKRELLRLSQSKVAKLLKTTQPQISRVEKYLDSEVLAIKVERFLDKKIENEIKI